MGRTVRILVFLSSLWILATQAAAHEVRPAIADIALGPDHGEILIDLNLEAIIARIDLDGLDDTDKSAQAGDYDRLRTLPPEELETAFRDYWPIMRDGFSITVDSTDIAPELTGITVAPMPDLDLPRDSVIALRLPGGAAVTFAWAREFGAIILRQQGVPVEKAYTGFLKAGERSPIVTRDGAEPEGAGATFLRYISVGFDHIVPKGLDHILFVMGLFFLSPRWGALLWQISAFTLAHTVTLALGALGLVVISPAVVEPLIAASIVYVAVENIFRQNLGRFRPVLIFGFGLLHGLGFASVLGDFGLPDAQFIPALIGFNIGVEVGQLAVVAATFLAVGLWFRNKSWYRRAIAIPASGVIAAIGAYWVVERTLL